MICQPCRDAADTRAPRDQHCNDPKCPCGHRTDRSRAADPAERLACNSTLHWPGDNHIHRCTLPAGHEVRGGVFHVSVDKRFWQDGHTDVTPHLTDPADQCRAEYHEANTQSGRCDLPTGHDEPHCDRSVPGVLVWMERVAMYPTDTTRD